MKNKFYLLITLLYIMITSACTSPQTLSPTILHQTETPNNLQMQTDNTYYKFLSPTVVQNTAGTMTFEFQHPLQHLYLHLE